MSLATATPSKGDSVCVLVASCDNTFDVFERVAPAWRKFWHDCPYPKFVGLNSERGTLEGFEVVLAPVGGWRKELATQVRQLPYEYVLLFLDDFLLLGSVATGRVAEFVDRGVSARLDYLRMIPISRSLLSEFWHRLTRLAGGDSVEEIPNGHPYYSSLQVALWRKEHLLDLLGLEGSIWEFEHQAITGRAHYAAVRRTGLRYLHVVEKGRWLPAAKHLFSKASLTFEPGSRAAEPASREVHFLVGKVKFLVFGYAWLRLKRSVSRIWGGRVGK